MEDVEKGIDFDDTSHLFLNVFHTLEMVFTISLTICPVHRWRWRYDRLEGMHDLIKS
jgi:hypothetical protein